MPPHLHKGVARQQHVQRPPPTEYFCNCYECCNSWDIDRSTRAPIRGRYISQAQWKDHRQREIRSGIASARLAAAALEIQGQPPDALPSPPHAVDMFPVMRDVPTRHPSPPEESALSPGAHSPPASPRQRKGKKLLSGLSIAPGSPRAKGFGDPALSFHAKKLKELRTRLENYGVRDLEKLVQVTPLVFVLDPSRHSDQSPLPQLDEDASANSAVIEYRAWLQGAQAFISDNNFGGQRDGVHVRLQSTVILEGVKREALALTRLQNEEWERQRAAGPGPQINSLDTGVFRTRDAAYVLKFKTQLATLQGLSAPPNRLQ